MPKRSDQRRRRNKTDDLPTGSATAVGAKPPPAAKDWHPVAKRWYQALAKSGQAVYYEASDWATAVLIAESMSRDLNPQVITVTDDGEVVRDVIPLKGANLSAYLKAMSNLLVTEGDRRRMRVELQQPEAEAEEVASLDDYRRRLGAG